MLFSKTACRLGLVLTVGLLSGCSSEAPEKSQESLEPMPNWPPRIIYNTDGTWAFNYLHRRDPKDLTIVLDALDGKGIDVISVLVGIDDDLSWRHSSHGSMWGENVQDWNPDGDAHLDSVGGMNMSHVELLHKNLAAIQDDGHDLMKILVERAHGHQMGIFASFRMNDAHVSYEDRGWYGRSKMKLERTDLLIGSTVERFSAGRADEWNFAWQWLLRPADRYREGGGSRQRQQGPDLHRLRHQNAQELTLQRLRGKPADDSAGRCFYRQGAAGFHLFNYDYRTHRPNPAPKGESLIAETPINTWAGHFTSADLGAFAELASEEALTRLDRCYYAATRELNHHGDYPPQVPYKLSTIGRGAGPANAIRIRVDDDIAGGLADGRIKKIELRLRFTNTQKSFDRIRCEVNGTQVDLSSATTIKNFRGQEWLVLENPPVKNGINTILLALEGMKTPAEYTGRGGPWPTIHNCEIIVRCED